MRGGRFRHDESAFTVAEIVVAMTVFLLVITAVGVTVAVVEEHQAQLVSSTQSLDTLQVAEQTVIRDVHAAMPTSTHPGGFSTASSTELAFEAALNNATPTVDIKISNQTLTVTTTLGAKTTTQVLLRNVDASSAFAVDRSCTVTLPGPSSTTYDTDIGVTLTQDSPSVTAIRPTKTTVAAPNVQAFNVQYAYAAAAQQTFATVSGTGC